MLVVGAGLAGLSAALAAAPRKVLVLTDAPLEPGLLVGLGAGRHGRGAVRGDSAEAHAADTVAAGAGLVDPAMARLLAARGPAPRCARWPLSARRSTATADGGFAQSLEAAHSRAPRRPGEGRPGRRGDHGGA